MTEQGADFGFTELRQAWADADARYNDPRTDAERRQIEIVNRAVHELMGMGWKNAIYCPKDGTRFLAIEPFSTGVYPCRYEGEWPNGRWWSEAHGDLWPARPILWKPLPEGWEPYK